MQSSTTSSISATKQKPQYLLASGRNFFEWLWAGLRDVVCKIYDDKITIVEGKDLAAYIAGILITAGKIANPLAALVIVIAVRKGLDQLCVKK